MLEFGKDTKIVMAMNAVAAGTGDTQAASTPIDTLGFDNVLLIALIGTVVSTGTAKFKAQQGAASNGSDAADLAGSGGTTVTASNKLALIDIVKPQASVGRYITPAIVRGTANVTINGVIAILYNGRTRPEVADTSVAGLVSLFSPALGTA